MKHFLITLTIFFSISAFAADMKPAHMSKSNLTCVIDDSEHNFEIDYNLPREKTRTKLMAALTFEDYLHQQIRKENDKYDKLAARKLKGSKNESKRQIGLRLSVQYQKTMDLLSEAETLSKYIHWLRS